MEWLRQKLPRLFLVMEKVSLHSNGKTPKGNDKSSTPKSSVLLKSQLLFADFPIPQVHHGALSTFSFSNPLRTKHLQGDTSGCSLGFVDIKEKIPF